MNLTTFLAFLLALGASAADSAPSRAETPQDLSPLHFDKPARYWSSEALPIGNGFMGGMIFGGLAREEIQFNDKTLWTSTEQDTGAYQNFGSVFLSFANAKTEGLTLLQASPAASEAAVAAVSDQNLATKWCLENRGAFPLSFQLACAKDAPPLTSYSITSAEDVPERDPKDWKLSASDDLATWTLLEHHRDEPIWSARHQVKTFKIENRRAYRYYRLEFLAVHNQSPHIQFAELAFDNYSPAAAPNSYRRWLDIKQALAGVSYPDNGTHYRREFLCSLPARVLAAQFSADKPGVYSGEIQLRGAHGEKTLAGNDCLSFSGKLGNGISYACRLQLVAKGGKVEVDGDALRFHGCDSLELYLAPATDFVQDSSKGWRGAQLQESIDARLEAAVKLGYAAVRQAHIADHRKLFDRATVQLAPDDPVKAAMPMDRRLADYGKGPDVALEQFLFDYGRYLLIASSRPGSLPANLQGVWNHNNNPPWRCDYHADINVDMNYWPAEVTNLSECAEPFTDYVDSIREVRKRWTKATYKTEGWTIHYENGPLGGGSWYAHPPGAAWYGLRLWEHYLFTGDREYLQRILPILSEMCLFWEGHLKELNGQLVSPKGFSAEHGPFEDAVAYDHQLIWELMTDYIRGCDLLGQDKEHRDRVAATLAKLMPQKIGSWGQIQEWQLVERDRKQEDHRHLSHLIGLFPGYQFVNTTPELRAAAKVSLNARGDGGAGFSIPWKMCCWARLGDAERAYSILHNKFIPVDAPANFDSNRNGSFANLFNCVWGVLQIEGNLGYTAGIAEMLLQSHAGEIVLLPALPQAWAKHGSFTGLKARGGFSVDCAWQDGKVTSYKIRSADAKPVKIRVNGEVKTITSDKL